jgi:hypothetical protein
VAALAGYFYRFEGKKTTNEVLPPKPVYPFVDCTDNDCNFPLTTGGRPSAETSVAINPKDPKNIVASSNDLNNPSQDSGSTTTRPRTAARPGSTGSFLATGAARHRPSRAWARPATRP